MVSVVQGWEVHEYLWMLDRMKEQGVLSRLVAIGSVCRRNQDQEIRNVITAIRKNLPRKYRLHAFGVKVNALRFKDVFDALWSADSLAYAFTLGMGLKGEQNKYRFVAANFKRFKAKIDYYARVHREQRTLEFYDIRVF